MNVEATTVRGLLKLRVAHRHILQSGLLGPGHATPACVNAPPQRTEAQLQPQRNAATAAAHALHHSRRRHRGARRRSSHSPAAPPHSIPRCVGAELGVLGSEPLALGRARAAHRAVLAASYGDPQPCTWAELPSRSRKPHRQQQRDEADGVMSGAGTGWLS